MSHFPCSASSSPVFISIGAFLLIHGAAWLHIKQGMDISLSGEINLSPKGKVSSLLKHTALLSFLALLLPRNIQQQTIWFSKVIECQPFTFVFQWLLSLPFLYWVPSHWLPINTNTEAQTCRHAWNTTHTSQALPGLGWPHKVQTNAVQLPQHSQPGVFSIPQTKPSLFSVPLLFICEIQELVLLSFFLSIFFLPQMEADICMYSLNSQRIFFFWRKPLPAQTMKPPSKTPQCMTGKCC